MSKILIGINTLTAVEQPAYSNHLQYFFRLGRETQHTFAINTPRRMSIDRMRNMTAKIALENEMDYVLFIDDDVIIPINSLQTMIDADCDIIAGWTIIRGHPFENMFFQFDGEGGLVPDQDPKIAEDGLIHCAAVGFSYCLIKCELLKKVNPPFFVTGTHNTEDIYFCMKARQRVSNLKIAVHPEIKTYHIVGPEMVGPQNRENYKLYIEQTWPELVKQETPADRGEEYLERVKSAS